MTAARIVIVVTILAAVALNDIKGNPLNVTSQGYPPTESVQYEVIDVSNNKNNSGDNIQHTGETTRFYTTGEVDDNFWLKHLGEDFKRAIHLQVDDNNNPYANDEGGVNGNGNYNFTHDGNHVKVEHDYTALGLAHRNPVQAESSQHFSSSSSSAASTSSSSSPSSSSSASISLSSQQQFKINYPKEENEEQATESSSGKLTKSGDSSQRNNSSETLHFTIVKRKDNTTAIQSDDGKSQQETSEDAEAAKKSAKRDSGDNQESEASERSSTGVGEKVVKYKSRGNKMKKIPHLYRGAKNEEGSSNGSKEKRKKFWMRYNTPPPIVITLPDNQSKVHQLDESDEPVVVNMPPIIYHQSANHEHTEGEDYPHHHHHHQQQHEHTHLQSDTHAHPHDSHDYTDNTNVHQHPDNTNGDQLPANTNTHQHPANTNTHQHPANTNTHQHPDNTNTHQHPDNHLSSNTNSYQFRSNSDSDSYNSRYTDSSGYQHQRNDEEQQPPPFPPFMRSQYNVDSPFVESPEADYRFMVRKRSDTESFQKQESDGAPSFQSPLAPYGNEESFSRNSRSSQQEIFDKGL